MSKRHSIWTDIRELWQEHHGTGDAEWKLMLSYTFQRYGYDIDEMSGEEIYERLVVMEEIRVINEHWAERFCIAAIEYFNSVREAGKFIDHIQFNAGGNRQFDDLMKLVQARMENMTESYRYIHERPV